MIVPLVTLGKTKVTEWAAYIELFPVRLCRADLVLAWITARSYMDD